MFGMLRVERYINTLLGSNSWIISLNKEAFLVDCGDFMNIFCKYPYSFKGVFLTHTHVDHIYGLEKFLGKFPQSIVYTSDFGSEALFCSRKNLSRYFNVEIELDRKSFHLEVVHEGDAIHLFDKYTLEVFETPGHDLSSLTYKVGNYLFTGDSYIPHKKTITSFPYSNKENALLSEMRIKKMIQGVLVCPGHEDMMKC